MLEWNGACRQARRKLTEPQAGCQRNVEAKTAGGVLGAVADTPSCGGKRGGALWALHSAQAGLERGLRRNLGLPRQGTEAASNVRKKIATEFAECRIDDRAIILNCRTDLTIPDNPGSDFDQSLTSAMPRARGRTGRTGEQRAKPCRGPCWRDRGVQDRGRGMVLLRRRDVRDGSNGPGCRQVLRTSTQRAPFACPIALPRGGEFLAAVASGRQRRADSPADRITRHPGRPLRWGDRSKAAPVSVVTHRGRGSRRRAGRRFRRRA